MSNLSEKLDAHDALAAGAVGIEFVGDCDSCMYTEGEDYCDACMEVGTRLFSFRKANSPEVVRAFVAVAREAEWVNGGPRRTRQKLQAALDTLADLLPEVTP